MLNGDGLRVVLWVSGCSHHCKNCHNPLTWDENDGIPFTPEIEKELLDKLSKPYIKGITFSGGDPFHINNRDEVRRLSKMIKCTFPEKDIWVYTGYTIEELYNELTDPVSYLINVDVLVDGRYIEELSDNNLHWVGSSNQRIIDVQREFRLRE